ncbi:MAG: malate dehydrogenase [Thermoprotei archaeon]|nr:MAG: malate dehydrogenase [Thermoprotei archaeon]
MHIGIVGVGRVGRALAYTLIHENYITELSLVDIIPNLSMVFSEELRHALASLGREISINHYTNPSDMTNADIVLITAGKPRTPDMTRRDLAHVNARIIKDIAESVFPGNKEARFIVVTNPVDAMAMLFKKLTRAEFVISSGTHLDTLRFKVELARTLGVPVRHVETYVAGEHGPNSVFLWSLTRVNGIPLHQFLHEKGISLNTSDVELKVKEIARQIISVLGGTCYGPAAAFRDIVRAIALNTCRILSIASPIKVPDIPEEVMVSVPQKIGRNLGYTLLQYLSDEEKGLIYRAGKAIYETYLSALRHVEQS